MGMEDKAAVISIQNDVPARERFHMGLIKIETSSSLHFQLTSWFQERQCSRLDTTRWL